MIQKNRIKVENILWQWGLQARSFKKIKDVYMVQTDQGLKNLKVSPLLPNRLFFVHQAIDYLIKKGFDKMNPLIRLPNGLTYFTDGQYAYSLFDWIEGRQCNFKNSPELVGATRILAEFHLKSYGFRPPESSNWRNRLGKCQRHFNERYQDLLIFKETAATMPGDPFARLYLNQVDFFLPMAVRAIEKLHSSDYPKLVQSAQFTMPFCHGDPAARNFILTPARRILMIDFDSCRLDLPLMDLIKFTRRVMKKYHWNYQTAKLLIDSYQEINRLTRSELDVMKAVFYFPQKFWRMANRYFHEHQRHTPERSLHKFQKYLQNKKALAQFQTDFESY